MQNNSQHGSILTLKILWGALFFTLFIYSFVVFQKYGAFELINASEFTNPTILALSMMAVLSLVLAIVVPKLFIKAGKKAIEGENADMSQYTKAFFLPFILKLVLVESTVIYGLVLSFMIERNVILPFTAVAVVIFAINFPSEKSVRCCFMDTK